ncbi:Uncharacterised protein [Bordetella trematum]|uniref:hypothetical protein n=1 Tax=Bordetella trematum TaxID=123899 RepID=UPI00079B6ED2|nr:hypothetical protein [Bordetella trematum]SAI62873.1 Uncharacterised protein [Bordetella trematum]
MNRYLQTHYVKGGRGPLELDCYGLVRLARTELYGKPLLPLCAEARPGDLRAITRAVKNVAVLEGMHPAAPAPGAIATAWRASLCVHVGIVVDADGRLWVLETDEPTGPCLTRMADFERRYTKVMFYDDQGLPEPASWPAD